MQIMDVENKKIIVELEDGSTKEYLDKESYLADFPKDEKRWIALENSIKNCTLTEEQKIQTALSEAQYLLDSTEFKFNVDYDLKDTPEWLEIKAKRQEAREFIRDHEGV